MSTLKDGLNKELKVPASPLISKGKRKMKVIIYQRDGNQSPED
jgi:hypothetical protein